MIVIRQRSWLGFLVGRTVEAAVPAATIGNPAGDTPATTE
jgi:hypothetical protein